LIVSYIKPSQKDTLLTLNTNFGEGNGHSGDVYRDASDRKSAEEELDEGTKILVEAHDIERPVLSGFYQRTF
jgi:hypothetical protein